MATRRRLAAHASNGNPRSFDSAGEIRFVLQDRLEHPCYWWPKTLLTYPLRLRGPLDLSRLGLTNIATGERLPIQISNPAQDPRTINVSFFPDLPSGARREFVLSTSASPVSFPTAVKETHDSTSIILDAGPVKVRLPATQLVRGTAPGPIMQLSRGGNWIGSSTLTLAADKVAHITTTRVANGPLFIAYEIVYESTGGARYVARVEAIAGMDFVRLHENMEGLRPGTRGEFLSDWSGFAATHRQSPNHPFPLPDVVMNYEDYTWEAIDSPWTKPDVKFGASLPIYPEILPTGQLPIFIGIYEPAPGNTTIGSWANYWDHQSGDAIGLFIDDAASWQDHEYAYEVESPTLQISAFYQEKTLSWKWPLVRGRRATCVTLYDHAKDKQAMQAQEGYFLASQKDPQTYRVPLSFTSHTLFLQNRYGTLDLNRVKEWVLEYPSDARRPPVVFNGGGTKTATDLEHNVMTSAFVSTLPITGTRQMDGHGPIPGRSIVNFSPVPSRQIQGSWIDAFNRLNGQMTERQRTRLTAMYLLMAYVLSDEDFMPQVQMLAGHPNYFADVKATAPAMSFLFPDHPLATIWADMWEKLVALNTRFNTRPAVKTWNADGGRWTEDIGTYVWAFVRPSLRTDFLLRKFDGQERFVTPQLAEMAEWLVNVLSAPFDGESTEGYKVLMATDGGREWGVVAPGQGPRRVYPPIGAHAEQRIPPRAMWYLGTCLHRYAPMAAEHAMWASRPTDQDAETAAGSEPPWDDIMYAVKENPGTNPHLRSRKHTGYGVTLRAAVGTPNELSVHLQQIDQGPNYRWGWAGEGGCGLIYFYAAGKSWSLNGPEDVGDRRDQDTDFCTNFGVFRNGVFHSIGENVLSRPFYDLGAGQFAELVPRATPPQEPANQYLSRSILLAGHDYFVVYDAVLDQSTVHRLSWFVRRGDELPFIQLVRGSSNTDRETQRTDHQTIATTGVWFDGVGDSMAVVSHRKDMVAKATPFGCIVTAPGVKDLVFRTGVPVQFAEGSYSFHGTSGLIRESADRTDFALFHGTQIGVQGYVFTTESTDLGIGGAISAGQPVAGDFYAPTPATLRIKTPADNLVFHIDAVAATATRDGSETVVTLPAGQHQWELTSTLPVPLPPEILRTENRSGGARIILAPSPAATKFQIEVSKDSGATWTSHSTDGSATPVVSGLENGQKVHVRAIAANASRTSKPGREYPLYVTNQPPQTPDGVQVNLRKGAAIITWGEVLGVRSYTLYARPKGQKDFLVLTRTATREYTDHRPTIQPCNERPGGTSPSSGIWEYTVASTNDNGESQMSRVVDTDPSAWLNWDPKPGEPFRRVYSYPQDTLESANQQPRYYPA